MVLKILRSKKFARRTLIILCILIIPAFVLWGVGSMANRPPVIGRIGKTDIRPADLEESRQGVKLALFLYYYGNYEMLNKILQNRSALNYMAWERLVLLNEARLRKITVSDNQLMSFIAQHPIFQRNGVFDKEIYHYIMRNNLSMEPRQFEEMTRENLKVQLTRQDILKDVTVSEEELLKHYKRIKDNVQFSYVVIDAEAPSKQDAATDDQIRGFYEANHERLFEPEKAEVEYIESSYYGNAAQKEMAAAQLEKLLPDLKKDGASFEMAAKENSFKYGKPAAFKRDDVVSGIPFFKDFNDTAFTLKEDEVSGVIYSSPEYGTAYLLHKVKTIPIRYLSFDESKEMIKDILAKQKSIFKAMEKAVGLYEKINSGSMTLENAAEELNKKIKSSEPASAEGYIENIGPAKDVVLRSYEVEQGKVIPPVIVKDGAFLGRVEKIVPGDVTGFDKEKEALRDTVLNLKKSAAIESWMKENKPNFELKKNLNEL